ncbi:polyisoprenoid-binding protein YceI [Nocardia transvalensis]|uniref:Polyisoprenoid-binding protein YceI n=1 Tax=Nocardia transvalensis TaxID=37333 RepID=A0A7W9UJV2_9NOCA|nr:YceI family protein [Nocardia transvalensis]MBB5915045.1 polyisoprenoid-binding protein YceI [Nocardia transvalensis]
MSGLTAQIRTVDGWPVAGAVLTVTSLEGRQLARAVADETGAAATDPLPAGMHTAVVTAPGHKPVAQIARVSSAGSGTLGDIRLDPETDSVETPPAGPWTIDPVHSSVVVTARHLGIASIKARFADVGGRLDVAENFERTTGYAEIKAASIDTGIGMRDDHLRSAEFLDVEVYPVIGFHSTGLRRTGADSWVMTGELDLHGQRRPVDLNLTYGGYGPDPWGGVRAAFHAETLLRRDDFAIDYNAVVRAGVAAVGTTVKIDLDMELVQGDRLPEM